MFSNRFFFSMPQFGEMVKGFKKIFGEEDEWFLVGLLPFLKSSG